MRHIRIYEDFNEVPAGMRDLFDLTADIEIQDFAGSTLVFRGPSENEEEAQILANNLEQKLLDCRRANLGIEPIELIIKEKWMEYGQALEDIGYKLVDRVKHNDAGLTNRLTIKAIEKLEGKFDWDKETRKNK